MVLEIAAGTWSGSMALLADGWHMGTHSAAFLIAIFAYSYAKKNANNKLFSFSTGKVNYLGGFASAIALAIVALLMVVESVQRIIEPNNIYFNEAIIVAVVGLIVNIVSAFILKDDHHHHDHDHNMKAAYLHVLADALTSVLAIVALLTGKYMSIIWIDPVMGIVGAIVIFHWSYGLIKESSGVLLDKSIDVPAFEKISQTLNEKNTIINDIHVWKIATTHQAAILSVPSPSPLSTEEYKKLLSESLPQLSHISVEVNKI